jgi:2Fe-2S ferredoxin
MPKISFIEPSGKTHLLEAQPGLSVMEVATRSLEVPGIIGECGGCCTCATCHVYVDEAWFGKLHAMDEMEQGMLEGAVDPMPLSRLSCQIKVTEELDGLIVRIPAGQI